MPDTTNTKSDLEILTQLNADFVASAVGDGARQPIPKTRSLCTSNFREKSVVLATRFDRHGVKARRGGGAELGRRVGMRLKLLFSLRARGQDVLDDRHRLHWRHRSVECGRALGGAA
jgi:hypothetical protein